MANLMPAILFTQQGAFLTSGSSPIFQAPGINGVVIHGFLNTIAGGSSPSIQFFLNEVDPYGNILGVFALTALTANGSGSESDFHGSFPGTYRVQWVVTGAPTTCNGAITVFGVP